MYRHRPSVVSCRWENLQRDLQLISFAFEMPRTCGRSIRPLGVVEFLGAQVTHVLTVVSLLTTHRSYWYVAHRPQLEFLPVSDVPLPSLLWRAFSLHNQLCLTVVASSALILPRRVDHQEHPEVGM